MRVFNLPDLGEGLREAEIVAWHVAVGEEVQADAPLCSVETDKAVVEIPAPRSGRIERLHGAVGDILTTGSPLIEFTDGDGERQDSGTVVGEVRAGNETLDEQPLSVDAGRAAGVRATPAVRALARRLEVDLTLGSAPAAGTAC